MIDTTKTANQLYKESGTDLPFSQWIEEQKLKGIFIKNDTLNNIVQNALEEKPVPSTPIVSKTKFLGLSKPVLIISGVVIISAIIYKITTSKK